MILIRKSLVAFVCSLLLALIIACGSARPAAGTDPNNSVDTAYGEQDAKTYTGNAKAMKTDRLMDRNILDMLRRTPGLRVVGSDNNPQVTLVGTPATQLTAMSPLFVIDGMRVGHEVNTLISAVNVNDVARITVLKDPADTSIYGLDGTNGVVIIRTKKQ